MGPTLEIQIQIPKTKAIFPARSVAFPMGALRLKGTKSKSIPKPEAGPKNPTQPTATKTTSELAFERAHIARLAKNPPPSLTKSHKEKVEDFNRYLSKLSDHYDVPKVGPG